VNPTAADLIGELKARLAQEAWVSCRGIWVDAREGIIALIRVVSSEEEKAALATMARGISRRRGVENHLIDALLAATIRYDVGMAVPGSIHSGRGLPRHPF
jgi:hypothetical protein